MAVDFDGTGIVRSHIMQLPGERAVAYVTRMRSTSADFRGLLVHFERRGFRFDVDRVRVFVYVADSIEGDIPTAHVLALLPSYGVAFATDPGHQAVTVGVHDSGAAIAGMVDVEHEPYRLTRFTTVIPAGEGADPVEHSVGAEELSSLTAVEIAARIGPHAISFLDPRPAPGTMDVPDLDGLSAALFRELLGDPQTRPMYPASAIEALLAQTPLVQKFATVNALQQGEAVRQVVLGIADPKAARTIRGACSCSTSCNACTSTSCSITIGKATSAQ